MGQQQLMQRQEAQSHHSPALKSAQIISSHFHSIYLGDLRGKDIQRNLFYKCSPLHTATPSSLPPHTALQVPGFQRQRFKVPTAKAILLRRPLYSLRTLLPPQQLAILPASIMDTLAEATGCLQ